MTSAFISHSSKDRGFVEQLARDLRGNGVQPWYDQWEMLPGDSLTQKIASAIWKNEYFVVVLSPHSTNSEWVQKELGVALTREFRERKIRVIPVLLRPCKIPPFLQDKVYADFQHKYRDGLVELLRALGSPRAIDRVKTSVPDVPADLLVWDNVTSINLTAANVMQTNAAQRR